MSESDGIPLLGQITCPNCWAKFPPESALAISGHADLIGDPLLTDETERRRFVPTRFTPEGAAVDEKGDRCLELACPECHLLVPRVLLERRETLFLSIFGQPSSGKSVFLAALARQMETTLPQRFGLGFTEPHPASNTVIRDYKGRLFNETNPDALVVIPKTEPSGHRHYQTVKHGLGDERMYPRPMFFQIAPIGSHPHARMPQRYTRTICVYDHAGEHFGPGFASSRRPTTQHLARSSALLFVFDPTSEPAFVQRCRSTNRDPQFGIAKSSPNLQTQEVILSTADADRKTLLGREIANPLDTPLVVILAKFDAWKHVVTGDLPPYSRGPCDGLPAEGFLPKAVESISAKMRDLLMLWCPGIVSTAERCSRRVCYIPVSASGASPVDAGRDLGSDPPRPILKFRRGDINPVWAEVPLLWILDQVTTGLVPVAGRPMTPPPVSPPPPEPPRDSDPAHETPRASSTAAQARESNADADSSMPEPDDSWATGPAEPDPFPVAEDPEPEDDGHEAIPSWTVSEILREAWALSNGFKGTFWLTVVLLVAVAAAIQWCLTRSEPFLVWAASSVSTALAGTRFTPQTVLSLIAIMFIVLKQVIVLIGSVFLTWPLAAGALMLAVQRAGDQPADFLSVGRWMRRWRGIAALNILLYLSAFFWATFASVAQELEIQIRNGASGLEAARLVCFGIAAALFVVPGLYLMVGYAIAMPLLLERNLSPWQALATSRRLIHPVWWRVFILGVACFGMILLGVFGLAVGLIWILPTVVLTLAVLYRKVLGPSTADTRGL